MENEELSVIDEDPIIKREYRNPASALKRPVPFVKAAPEPVLLPSSTTSRIGDNYLALVLPSSDANSRHDISLPSVNGHVEPQLCTVCHLPLDDASSATHTTSIAHQICLTHSHPPSALDRRRKGLAYLQEYGWDPDSRKGLGSDGREGILHPIQPQSKTDRSGIGTNNHKQDNNARMSSRLKEAKKDKEKKLNAKQVRKATAEDREKRDRLQRLFFMDDEVLKYLGEEP